jgi:hypothetical protein
MQKEGSSYQVQALISEPLTQKLGTYPPLGQASHTREGWVLLLESGEEGSTSEMQALRAQEYPYCNGYTRNCMFSQ